MKDLMFWAPYIYAILITIVVIILATKEEKDKPLPMKIVEYWDDSKERRLKCAEYAVEMYKRQIKEIQLRNKSLRAQNEYLAQRFADYYDKPKVSQNEVVCLECANLIVGEKIMTCEKLVKCGEFKRK